MIDHLKIGATSYRILPTNGLTKIDADGNTRYLYAKVNFGDDTIDLEESQSNDHATVCLWHESIHAILNQAGHTGDHPEQMIIALGYGLVELVRDNPQLIALTVGESDDLSKL